jgi:hypothetical protein
MVIQQRGQQNGPAPRTSRANYTIVEEIPTGEEVLAGSSSSTSIPLLFCSILENHMTLFAPPVLRKQSCQLWLWERHM